MEKDQYIVSARKYRPATFRSVVGQKNLTNTLKNAIDSGRLAQAYLFCGPRGVGKTSCARIFAKTINCLNPTSDGEACGVCESCRAIEEGTSFNIMELDAASNNGVDSIRSLNEQVNTPPQVGKYRVFIVDEVHMLSTQAFNAFLKTLEEPPSYVIFILATTEKHKVIPTILSRCQIYDFKRITVEDMAEHLAYVADSEGVKAEKEALSVIARKADGAMRDALSIFDQVASSTRGNVTYAQAIENLNVLDYDYYFRLTEAFRAGNVPEALLMYAEIRNKGFDSLYFVNGLATHVRDLMLAAAPSTVGLLEQSDEVAKRYQEQASSLPLEWYYAAMKLLNDCDQAYRTATEKRLLVELTLIRLCQLLKPPTPPFDRVDGQIPLQAISAPVYQPSPAPAADQTPAHAHTPDQAPRQVVPPVTPQPRSSTEGPRTAAPSGTRMGHTTSIRRGAAKSPEGEAIPDNAISPEVALSPRSPKENPYTREQFEDACGEFMVKNPQYRIMNTALRNHLPEPAGPDTFIAVASQQSEMKSYETDLRYLIEYLRSRLGNDRITIRAELREVDVKREPLLTPKEFLAQAISQNKALADFLTSTGGELT